MAAGPIVRLDRRVGPRASTSDAASEGAALRAAVAAATAALSALAERAGADGAEILAFQVAMLEDEAILSPALDLIEAGADAAGSWLSAISAQIADYESSDSEYFRARGADLADIRDRVLRFLAGEEEAESPAGAVLAGDDVTPSRFLSVDWSKGGGIALCGGSPSSHVAMLARSRGVPMVVGLGAVDFDGHSAVIVDGDAGRVVLSPGEDDWAALRQGEAENRARAEREVEIVARPAFTADGASVTVMINVGDPSELKAIDPSICDGVGLVRSEFLFYGASGLPDEESQYLAYRRIIEWAKPRPVVIRTLDAGGDKPIAGVTIDGESNPFLGTRGIRLSLARPEVFKIQVRALLRAAVHGNAKVMLPMVSVPREIDAAAQIFEECAGELGSCGAAWRMPPLGIMVEVPAVAIAPEHFARAAFFSIGSNDLTQYVTASARDIGAVAELNDPSHPAVIALISRVVSAAGRMGREISLCGDMGGEPAHLPALLAAGLRSVSVAPRQVGRAKRVIAGCRVTP